MALPDFLKFEVGTAKTWKNSGGDYAMTFASITNGNGRQGAKGDLGANRARLWSVTIFAAAGSAVTAPNQPLDVYWGASASGTAGTSNPGNLSGTDATFNTTPSEYAAQLIYVGSLQMSNNRGTSQQIQTFVFSPPQRYGMPVIVNSTGQTLGSTESDFQIVVTPLEEAVEDSV